METLPNGNEAHYDSSLGAYVMYATASYKTFPIFTNLEYPQITGSTQIGVVHIDFKCQVTKWAYHESYFRNAYTCVQSNNTVCYGTFNNLPNQYVTDTRYTVGQTWIRKYGTAKRDPTITKVFVNYGQWTYGVTDKSSNWTHAYNMWVDISETLSI